MVEWLLVVDIRTVEKESMGIYWVPLYEIFVSRGIEFFWLMLGTPKTCPAERLNINDAQWLQQLHSYGLVRASYQPDPCIAKLRAYFRQRDALVLLRVG